MTNSVYDGLDFSPFSYYPSLVLCSDSVPPVCAKLDFGSSVCSRLCLTGLSPYCEFDVFLSLFRKQGCGWKTYSDLIQISLKSFPSVQVFPAGSFPCSDHHAFGRKWDWDCAVFGEKQGWDYAVFGKKRDWDYGVFGEKGGWDCTVFCEKRG